MTGRADVIIVGGGHNGLVAAAYLARAGRTVIICEARDELGGAVAGKMIFPGVPARLSRFSYLVSLFPDSIISDLELRLVLRSRAVASYSPDHADGLLVGRPEGRATAESFRRRTGSEVEYRAWQHFYAELGRLARVVAPTLTEPLPFAAELSGQIGDELWASVVERPIGELIERTFADDLVRGTVFTDALIGTEAGAHDQSLRQNRCFLYHLIGNGTGEWKVPVGGMGAVADALVEAVRWAGAVAKTGHRVTGLHRDTSIWQVTLDDGTELAARTVLINCAPAELDRLLARSPEPGPPGNQIKINMVLQRLPRLRSGLDPQVAFAGTLHLNQGYAQLAEAHAAAMAGRFPDPLPCEVYCHTLTDDSILDPRLRELGWQTLTLFGLHTPADLFRGDPEGTRRSAEQAALQSLQSVLDEPLEDCLARDADGELCVETVTPLDLEREVGLPAGHIFHGDLQWPWRDDPAGSGAPTVRTGADHDHPAVRWGCATGLPGLLLCGSGARRGGAVSGIGGQNAARAVLELTG